MKTFRMIGMALFAILMCVNFASCGNDDGEIPSDPTGDSPTNQPTNEKKLVQVMIYDDEEALEEIIEIADSNETPDEPAGPALITGITVTAENFEIANDRPLSNLVDGVSGWHE